MQYQAAEEKREPLVSFELKAFLSCRGKRAYNMSTFTKIGLTLLTIAVILALLTFGNGMVSQTNFKLPGIGIILGIGSIIAVKAIWQRRS